MLLLIDNYDSFTYNLAHYFQMLGEEILIKTHDALTIPMIQALAPRYIVLSPGPKGPKEAGISLDVITHFYREIPLLGVCLGHQCLAEAFGAEIGPAPDIMHGKTSAITHNNTGLFHGLPSPFIATRYHSLAVVRDTLPDCFSIDAVVDETIMAISHRDFPLFGVQFHPEAILTEHGLALLAQFLKCIPHETDL